jgi:hypothetical protein
VFCRQNGKFARLGVQEGFFFRGTNPLHEHAPAMTGAWWTEGVPLSFPLWGERHAADAAETALSALRGEFDVVVKSGSPALAAFDAQIASVYAPMEHALRGSLGPFRGAAVASETRQELTPTPTRLPQSRGNRTAGHY